jgi:prepilin-type N-terminal cleavage/methylation domain-containing protein
MRTRSVFPGKRSGFTLIEVIISLAIFGLLIGGILGILPWGVEKSDNVKDRNTAQSLVDGVQIELERLGFSVVEWGTQRLDGLYRTSGEPDDIENGEIRKLILVASKNGQKISLERVVQVPQSRIGGKLQTDDAEMEDVSDAITYGGKVEFDVYDSRPISLTGFESASNEFIAKASNRWIAPEDRYFAVICSQYPKLSEGNTPSRHFHHPSNGYLALSVDVQWPYKLPGNQEGTTRIVEQKYRSNFTFPLAISR